MKTKMYYPLLLITLVAAVFSSCQKGVNSISSNSSTSGTISKTASTSTVLATGSIAVSTTTTLASTHPFSTRDSIYLTNCFPRHGYKDSIAFTSLPAAALTYLTTNYSGYTAVKAFSISDSTKTVINYVAVIKYNGNIVGVKFTTAGVFVAVLEQVAGQDLGGPQGCHDGGPFDDRGGFRPDTIALSAIPTVVKTYFTTNYPKDTLVAAGIAPDGNYVLISKNVTLFATVITPTGTLVSHIQLETRGGVHAAVTAANLPSAITTYLTATYPGYVFDKAFSVTVSGVLQGYDVFITSHNTKYLVQFNASGTFVGFKPVH